MSGTGWLATTSVPLGPTVVEVLAAAPVGAAGAGMVPVVLGEPVSGAALVAGAAYLAFDRGDRSAAGLYCYAVALAPGLLAALFLRGIDAKAVLWPTALALLATIAAVPGRNTAVLAVLALEASLLLTVRAATATARPWAHL